MDTALPHRVAPPSRSRYVHDALFFSSTDELAAATVPFVQEGLAAGDAVVVVASPPSPMSSARPWTATSGSVWSRGTPPTRGAPLLR